MQIEDTERVQGVVAESLEYLADTEDDKTEAHLIGLLDGEKVLSVEE